MMSPQVRRTHFLLSIQDCDLLYSDWKSSLPAGEQLKHPRYRGPPVEQTSHRQLPSDPESRGSSCLQFFALHLWFRLSANEARVTAALLQVSFPTLPGPAFRPTTCPPAQRRSSPAPEVRGDRSRPESRQGSHPSSRRLFLECGPSNGETNARLHR